MWKKSFMCIVEHVHGNNLFRVCLNVRYLKNAPSSTTDNNCNSGGALKISDTVQPVRMAYNSYESTNPIFATSQIPIIAMHGMLGSKNNWNSLSKLIHNTCRRKIFVVDARNHGDSPHSPEMSYDHLAEDLRQFMFDLSIKQATVIGHSMGGRAVMLFALKYPDLIENLLVVDISPVSTSPKMSIIPRYIEAMKKVKLDSSLRFSEARKLADEQMAAFIIDPSARQFFLTNLVQGESGHYKWRLNLDAVSRNFLQLITFPHVCKTFDKPTYFIGGENSDFIKREDHSDIRKIYPNAIFDYIMNAGHLVHFEQPKRFTELICKFLKEQSDGANKGK